MIARDLLRQACHKLQSAGCSSPRLDAELLLSMAWGKTRTSLIARLFDEVPWHAAERFSSLVQRRCNREPMAYIIGEKEFWSRSFAVNTSVLIPRAESEHLIEHILRLRPDKEAPLKICDIGTGSGCLAIILALEYPASTITALDISEKALQVAQCNALRHGVAERIRFLASDVFGSVSPSATFDIIVANPPYVSIDEYRSLEPELKYEPRLALTDESDGLSMLHRILVEGECRLRQNGIMVLETGCGRLPDASETLRLKQHIMDLAGWLRGGVYVRSVAS